MVVSVDSITGWLLFGCGRVPSLSFGELDMSGKKRSGKWMRIEASIYPRLALPGGRSSVHANKSTRGSF